MNATHGKSIEEVKIFGRFDFKFFREFKNLYEPLLHNDAVRTLEINLGGVDYIDSSALGMLLLLREKALKSTKKVVLTHCKGSTRDVLDVAHFSQLFEFK
jgi:HptB-dependent secretion and biofilm anti anti-sigma factor